MLRDVHRSRGSGPVNEVIRNGAPISCHDDAALARSRWTSAADENAPTDAASSSTIRTAAVVPPWVARRRARSGTSPRPRAAIRPSTRSGIGASRTRSARRRCRRGPGPRRRAGPRAASVPVLLAPRTRARGGATPRRRENDHDPIEDEPADRADRAGRRPHPGPASPSPPRRSGPSRPAGRSRRPRGPAATTVGSGRRPAAGRSRGGARARPAGIAITSPRGPPPGHLAERRAAAADEGERADRRRRAPASPRGPTPRMRPRPGRSRHDREDRRGRRPSRLVGDEQRQQPALHRGPSETLVPDLGLGERRLEPARSTISASAWADVKPARIDEVTPVNRTGTPNSWPPWSEVVVRRLGRSAPTSMSFVSPPGCGC